MEIILYICSDKVLVVRDVLVDADGMKACEFADCFEFSVFMRYLWWKQNTIRECVSFLLPSSSKDCGGDTFLGITFPFSSERLTCRALPSHTSPARVKCYSNMSEDCESPRNLLA